MDNIKYLPLGLFFAYSCKLLILGASYVDAPILAILAGLAAYYEFKKDKRIDGILERLDAKDKELNEIKNAFKEESGKLKDFVSGVKLTQQLRR